MCYFTNTGGITPERVFLFPHEMPEKQIRCFSGASRDVLSHEDDRQLGVCSVSCSSGIKPQRTISANGKMPPKSHMEAYTGFPTRVFLLFCKLTGSSAGSPGYKVWLFQQHQNRESHTGWASVQARGMNSNRFFSKGTTCSVTACLCCGYFRRPMSHFLPFLHLPGYGNAAGKYQSPSDKLPASCTCC